MAYKELIHEYSYKFEEDGRVHGSRTFIQDATGSILTLPTRNSSLLPDESGSDITGCYARTIQLRRDGDDPSPQYVVRYDTRSTLGSGSGSIGITSDESSRTFDGTAELLSIEGEGSGWEWEVNGDMDSGMALYKRAVLEHFTIAHHDLTTAEKDSLLAIMRDRAGTINAAAFEGFAIGQVYFDGWRGGDTINESGLRRWTFELTFIARLLTGEEDYDGNAITANDWQYLWRTGVNASFERPVKKGSSPSEYLYRLTNFSSLLP